MILKEFCLASFLGNEINLKHLSPGFKSIHVGLWTKASLAGGRRRGALFAMPERDSFPTSLTLNWGQPPTFTPSSYTHTQHTHTPKLEIYQAHPFSSLPQLFSHTNPALFTLPRELLDLMSQGSLFFFGRGGGGPTNDRIYCIFHFFFPATCSDQGVPQPGSSAGKENRKKVRGLGGIVLQAL